MPDTAEFCRRCATAVVPSVPPGDNRARLHCHTCGYIHYDNPNNVVGCLLHWNGKVLLCRRAIEPRHGFWTLPAGFMENAETLQGCARRECLEEANALIDDMRLFAVYSLPRISQVYVMFSGQLREGCASAGEETLEVGLFEQTDVPWGDLAFPVVTETLERFFEQPDPPAGRVLSADILSRPGAPLDIVRHSD